MKTPTMIANLPNVPAVYALYGGQNRGMYVAYVGLATKLKSRITQHLVNRDSSITTGVHPVSLNPDHVTKVGWWEHHDFVNSSILAAAELVAFDILDPILRSRGAARDQAKQLYQDESFKSKMSLLFQNEPSGTLLVPSLQKQVSDLETRIAELEEYVKELDEKLRNVDHLTTS